MSRKPQAFIEEDFDDDTDLPLPARPLPNTGSRGALIQSIDSDEDDDEEPGTDFGTSIGAGHSSPSHSGAGPVPTGNQLGQGDVPTVSDLTPYKKWICIYPIYVDAKRSYSSGSRRIAREKALWWPLSKDIADAASRMGLSVLHEINKTHPRDWENPGRVRVQWKKDGRLMNSSIKTKKQLLERICADIQKTKPENIPRPPFTASNTTSGAEATPTSTSGPTKNSSSTKGKQTASASKGKGKGKGDRNKQIQIKENRVHIPQPPQPHPALSSRVSPYSPALSSGVLIDTIKAGMSAGAVDGPGGAGTAAAGGKGKRKVVRVRG